MIQLWGRGLVCGFCSEITGEYRAGRLRGRPCLGGLLKRADMVEDPKARVPVAREANGLFGKYGQPSMRIEVSLMRCNNVEVK